MFLIIFYATYSFGAVFIMCELGQRITDTFEETCDTILAFEWYLFPYEIQKVLPTLWIGTQQPVAFECFGGISAVRETFKKVNSMENCD